MLPSLASTIEGVMMSVFSFSVFILLIGLVIIFVCEQLILDVLPF